MLRRPCLQRLGVVAVAVVAAAVGGAVVGIGGGGRNAIHA
jgi:hypothetical protein